jgi:threonine/homoserine/homoserine lactone efflux protein
MEIGAVWLVLSFSFVVALSGAIVPGPLFTYTIAKTVQSRRRGFLTGLWVTAGHAALEAVLIIGLLAGVSELFASRVALGVIGGAGCVVLLAMGALQLRDVVRQRVPELVPVAAAGPASAASPPAAGSASALQRLPAVLGGAVVSMSNPYWWIWWITVGSAFLVQYGIGWRTWPLLAAFFLGHEAGDLAWYLALSAFVHWGRRRLSGRVYLGILAACGILIIGFAVYLAVSLALRLRG